MIKHVEKEKKEQIAKNKVEEINDIVNFLNEQEVNENIQENEGNLLQDMLEGEKLVQKVDNAPAFVEKVIQPEKTLDEKFREAHKMAHENEMHPAKMKKSTLKKRRKEYEKKTREQNAMSAVKAHIEDMKSGPLRKSLMDEFSGRLGSPELTTDDNKYMDSMMDAVMYLSKNDNLSVSELSIISRDLTLDTKKLETRLLGTKAENEAKERLGGKFRIYEKLFNDALSWDPAEFTLKDNHVMAKDKDLSKKMEKLSIIPMLKLALSEYRESLSIENSWRKNFGEKDEKKYRMPEELLKELECRLTFFSDVKAEYECRIDLMSNKYYSLLGQSDTSNLKTEDLKKLSTTKEMDPELRAYYDAIKRHRGRKDTGRSLKGKSPKTVLEKIRKESGIRTTGSKYNKAIQTKKDDWERSFKTNYRNKNKETQRELIKNEGIDQITFSFKEEAMVDHEITTLYNSLNIELTKEKKEEIKKNFNDRITKSRRARDIINNFKKPFEALRDKLEGAYNYQNGGKFTGTREEMECVISYVSGLPLKINADSKDPKELQKAEDERYSEQTKIFIKAMKPFHSRYGEMTNKEFKEEIAEDSAQQFYEIFVHAIKNDNQRNILTKYKSPEEFCEKCTQEEYNYLKRLSNIGFAANNMMFENPTAHEKLMKLIDRGQFKSFYLQLKTSAYMFMQSVDRYMILMANNNYAFLDQDTLKGLAKIPHAVAAQEEKKADKKKKDKKEVKQVIKFNTNVTVDNLRSRAQGAFGQMNKARTGDEFDKMRQTDIEDYEKEIASGKWKKSLDLLKDAGQENNGQNNNGQENNGQENAGQANA